MNLSSGRIIFASRNIYKILSENETEYMAVLAGNFSQNNEAVPVVGDYVSFYANPDGDSIIHTVIERKSFLSRKQAGKKFEAQPIAANVDYLLIINAMDRSFSKRRIERFLIMAKAGSVTPVIILSKTDLCNPLDMAIFLSDAEEVAGEADIITLSSVTGEGLGRLEEMLSNGVTACLVGMSGSGKSTLTNALLGYEVRETTEVREDDSRGRHCTTDRHMFRLKSGAMLIDSPGVREVGVLADTEAIGDVFEEISYFASDCRFYDCTHVHEPDCAVIEAVERGDINKDRYDSYLKLTKEADYYRQKTEAPDEIKRSAKQLSRLVRSENKRKKKF